MITFEDFDDLRTAHYEYAELSDKPKRIFELIKNVLFMSPSPNMNHQGFCMGGSFELKKVFGDKYIIRFAPCDVFFENKSTTVQPDMIIAKRDIIRKNGCHGAPELILEILSPSTMKNDLTIKKDLYEENLVKHYWIADTDKKEILLYELENAKYLEPRIAKPGDTVEILGEALNISAMFSEVIDFED